MKRRRVTKAKSAEEGEKTKRITRVVKARAFNVHLNVTKIKDPVNEGEFALIRAARCSFLLLAHSRPFFPSFSVSGRAAPRISATINSAARLTTCLQCREMYDGRVPCLQRRLDACNDTDRDNSVGQAAPRHRR